MRHILELTGLRVIICDSGEEAFHILEGFSSSINLVIVVNDGPKVAEAKVRFSSKVKIYLFEEFLHTP
ncbi:Long-chain-fatty-acid--CoA ligase 5 [Schistosoma japonicum]|nr:Long-chain-fatty-acid--CoA ligase 5 [Schistosoma japonicum]